MRGENLIWNPEIETMSRGELRKVQLRRLKHTIERVYHNVPAYRRAFDENGVKPEDVKSLDDVRKLPFTVKNALRDNYPFGLSAEPLENIVRLHASSGTTGKPIVGLYNRHDRDEVWAELMARGFTANGVTSHDVVQISFGYGLFTGGLGHHLGVEKIGAAVVPASTGQGRRQVMLLEDLGVTVLCCTPSYALALAETKEEMQVTRDRLKLRCGIFGAEPWSEAMRRQIEDRWGIEAYNNYGLTEMGGPGVASECVYKAGMHIWEDHYLVEVIDPISGEPLDYGQEGELVFTSLTREAMPIIRYRTRDLAVLNPERCECGRTHVRMGRIRGRTDDMLIIRGVNVFPSQIEAAIVNVPDVEPQYVIVVDRQQSNLDTVEVRIEATEELWSRGAEAIQSATRRVNDEIHEIIGISALVKIVDPKSLQRSEGKAKRVYDLREM